MQCKKGGISDVLSISLSISLIITCNVLFFIGIDFSIATFLCNRESDLSSRKGHRRKLHIVFNTIFFILNH